MRDKDKPSRFGGRLSTDDLAKGTPADSEGQSAGQPGAAAPQTPAGPGERTGARTGEPTRSGQPAAQPPGPAGPAGTAPAETAETDTTAGTGTTPETADSIRTSPDAERTAPPQDTGLSTDAERSAATGTGVARDRDADRDLSADRDVSADRDRIPGADAGADRDTRAGTDRETGAGVDRETGAGTDRETGTGADRTAPDEESAPRLMAEDEEHSFRDRWHDVQSTFVDDPREAVHAADALVAEVMQTLAAGFARHKGDLEGQWSQGEKVDTEDLRRALRRYRSFFNRLLDN
ncbi:hypothetical protein [Streptomyces sp. NPDC046985]|uniref:hypothetical protein n=1 Tax=Streptomyces sp. NPDC046985 TaxID=3155377 RepID=UPI0034071A86